MDFLYQLIPNDTDVSVFKARSLPSLNFAFARGLEHYHTSADTPENLSLATLQHGGDAALHASNFLLNTNLSAAKAPETKLLYQDILSLWHVSYAEGLIRALAVVMLIGIIFCLWAWGLGPVRIFLATFGVVGFLAGAVGGAFLFHSVCAQIWGPLFVVEYFYWVFLAYVLSCFAALHFAFVKVKRKFPELSFGILVLLLGLCAVLQYYPSLGTLIVWTSVPVIVFCVFPRKRFRYLGLFCLALFMPQFLHTALIVDSGRDFLFPTILLCYGMGLLHLLNLNPYLRVHSGERRNPEDSPRGTYTFLHGLSIAMGIGVLAVCHFLLPGLQKKARADFFELRIEKNLFVGLGAHTKATEHFAEEQRLSVENFPAVMEFLGYSRHSPKDFHLYPLGESQGKWPDVDGNFLQTEGTSHRYLLDIPAQEYDCVFLSLAHLGSVDEIRVNTQIPFSIPGKDWEGHYSSQFLKSCGLREYPLRIEVLASRREGPAAETVAIFARPAVPPPELELGLDRVVMGTFSNHHYVLKKIKL